LYFPFTFILDPHTLSECKWIFVPPPAFFFLKISTSAGYMGFLVHIGFFIISPYPFYSVCSLCLLQEATFLLACRILALTSLVSAQRNSDRYSPKHVEVCGLCCNLPQWGKANRLFRSYLFTFPFPSPPFPQCTSAISQMEISFSRFIQSSPILKTADKKELHHLAYSPLSFIAKDL
jgi:hypothetical protein